jgi:hypothetical protein
VVEEKSLIQFRQLGLCREKQEESLVLKIIVSVNSILGGEFVVLLVVAVPRRVMWQVLLWVSEECLVLVVRKVGKQEGHKVSRKRHYQAFDLNWIDLMSVVVVIVLHLQ